MRGWQQREGSYQDDTNTRVRQGEAVEEKSYRLQKIRGGEEKGGEGKVAGGVTRQKGGEERERARERGKREKERETEREVQHPEESVLVDFGSIKSQKNMLNIWILVQRGDGGGREGLLGRTGGS